MKYLPTVLLTVDSFASAFICAHLWFPKGCLSFPGFATSHKLTAETNNYEIPPQS